MAEAERFEVRLTAGLKAALARAAQSEGISLGEMLVRAACRGLQYPEEDGVPIRGVPGRRPTVQAQRRKP